jgi:hypothetical protein
LTLPGGRTSFLQAAIDGSLEGLNDSRAVRARREERQSPSSLSMMRSSELLSSRAAPSRWRRRPRISQEHIASEVQRWRKVVRGSGATID